MLSLMCKGESESQMIINEKAGLQKVCIDVLKTTCSEAFILRKAIFGVRVSVVVLSRLEFGPEVAVFGKVEG